MELLDENGDAFDVRIFWRPSAFSQDTDIAFSELFPRPELDVPAVKLNNPYAPSKDLDHELQLPDLDTFKFGLFGSDEWNDPTTTSEESIQPGQDEHLDDLWNSSASLGPLEQDVEYFTWENFEDNSHVEGKVAYISEGGPHVFDALIRPKEVVNEISAPRVLRPKLVLSSLFNLGLGRSSPLFRFDKKRHAFKQTVVEARMPGFSLGSSQSIASTFLECGNDFQHLRSFVTKVYQSSRSVPARIALASSISTVLSVMESQLEIRTVETLLQLQQLFEKPRHILHQIREIVDATHSASTNEELSIALYHYVQTREQQDDHARAICLQLLSKVADPWLQQVAEWIGLNHEQRSGVPHDRPAFVAFVPAGNDEVSASHADEYVFNSSMMPSFIPEEDGRIIFETGNAVRFLRAHHPDHPLSTPKVANSKTPRLQWKFSWEDLEGIEQKAKDYERSLIDAIANARQQQGQETLEHTSHPPSVSEMGIGPAGKGSPSFDPEQYILESIKALDLPPSAEPLPSQDDLQDLLVESLQTDSNAISQLAFAPPTSLTPSLSLTPILLAQARLVNAVTLRLFFRSHSIRHHLSLQRQYHLLGDGVFVARLSSALFSPDLATAERQHGIVRTGVTMGLRLGSRTNWPPASSELRLALMGVLSDCYYSSLLYHSSSRGENDEAPVSGLREQADLPGQLSFSVRTLPEEDVEKLMDPRSLYALDFLRLQYVPPAPLHLIITSGSLEKYDDIFKLLLRLLRMLYVVDHLPHSKLAVAKSLRFDATHFVRSIASYFFDTGIRCKWDAFSEYLNSIESKLEREDADGDLGTLVREGLDTVREAHDTCLDRVMYTLFLRKRHAKVMNLLEELFEIVLKFATLMESGREDVGSELWELFHSFKSNLDVFLKVCKGLSGRKSKAGTSGSGDEDDIDRFLVLMEMNQYGISEGIR